MTIDPVCGMEIDEAQAQGKSEHNGKTFYFCSLSCKEEFDRDPDVYADNAVPSPYYA
jgi:YHS domain-containing protein